MGAVNDAGGPVDVAIAALMAGADLLLCCHDEDLQERIRGALIDEALRSPSVKKRLEEAQGRSVALRKRFVPKPASAEDLNDLLTSTTPDVVRELESYVE
jgi:beta-glucosidase-like glycosyl hydrolase